LVIVLRSSGSTLIPYTTLFRSLRNYKILLKTADRDTRVICDFLPPEISNAVFTTDHGSTLVAMTVVHEQGKQGEVRMPMAKIGEDRKSTRLNSSHGSISYAVFC